MEASLIAERLNGIANVTPPIGRDFKKESMTKMLTNDHRS